MAYKRKASSQGGPPSKRRKTFRRGTPKKKSTAFAKRVKAVIMKSAEPKRMDGQLFNNLYFVANTPLSSIPMYSMVNGTGLSNRIGDSVNLRGISMKMLLQGTVLADTNLRVICFFKPGTPNTGFAINYNDIFTGAYSNYLLDRYRGKEDVQVVFQKNIKINAETLPPKDTGGIAINSSMSRSYKFWVPFRNKKFTFDKGLGTGVNGDYYIAVISDRTSANNNTVSNLQLNLTYSVYFRDP